MLSHPPAFSDHIHGSHIQHFRLKQGFDGTPDLDLIGLSVNLEGNLIGLPFLQVGFFGDVRFLDHLIDIHD